jgi:hypothetical protein
MWNGIGGSPNATIYAHAIIDTNSSSTEALKKPKETLKKEFGNKYSTKK